MKRIPNLHEWHKLAEFDPLLPAIAKEVLRAYPTTQALLFYGSHIQGRVDGYSDYDVLAIMPSEDVPDWWERGELAAKLRERYGIKLEFVVTSPGVAWLELRIAPYLRHWLESGVVLGDGNIFPEPLPPLAKEGARVSLGSIECDLEILEEAGSRRWKGEILMRALRRLILLRAAISGQYPYDLKREVEQLVGATTSRRLRNPKGRVQPDDLERLRLQVERLQREVKDLAAAMPENASDQDLMQIPPYRKIDAFINERLVR